MAKRTKTTDDILIDLLIVQCASVGLTGHQIRDVVGVDMNRVSRIIKYFKKKKGAA
jgi:transposase-like protein